MEPTLFQQVIEALHPYFGSRTEEFIRRQCAHIKVQPEMLTKKDIPFLAYWAGHSAKLVLSKENADLVYRKLMSFGEEKQNPENN